MHVSYNIIFYYYTNDIRHGRKDFNGFTLPEHAGLCNGDSSLFRTSIVVSYARRSLTAGSNAESSEEGSPANWQIDEEQERLLEKWARAKDLWFENSDSIIQKNFGPMIAQGAEAKVYYKEGDPSVAKERTSIYSTTNKALEAIALHNYLFLETAMKVIGYTRDSDSLLRIVLTQPYVNYLRLATKEEIDDMVADNEFRDNWNGQGVNYISDRLALEDMHPANVFIDVVT